MFQPTHLTRVAQRDLNSIVLSYHDTLIREGDLRLLEPGGWLSDALIGFAFEYFEQSQFKPECRSNELAFIGPEVTQLLRMSYDDPGNLEALLSPLEVTRKKVVFFAVNNNDEPSSAGGSHWSLAKLDVEHRKLIHYDSLVDSNRYAAMKLLTALNTYFRSQRSPSKSSFAEQSSNGERGARLGGRSDDILMESFADCPQQVNTSDCGVFLIAICEFLCQKRRLSETNLNNELRLTVTPSYVAEKRLTLKKLILQLAATSHKSSS